MNEELRKQMLAQGITLLWGFDGKPQYYKSGKLLKGKEFGDAALLHSRLTTELKRGNVNQSLLDFANDPLVQTLDPSGVSNYPEAYASINKALHGGGFNGQDALNVVGALPLSSTVKKVGKVGKFSVNLIKDMTKKPVNKAAGVVFGTALGATATGAAALPLVEKAQDVKQLLSEGTNLGTVKKKFSFGGMVFNNEEEFFNYLNELKYKK